MRAAWAIVAGLVLGGGLAWWLARDQAPQRSPEARQRAEQAAAANAEDAQRPLYRWRDDAGSLQITDTPPKGRPFERIAREPASGIRVHGQ
ncbi:DUF4124 domain-containing protein [Pseudoxanthomonas daejeonensis]|uniref:DUF4124 domain-containing protein n=1 Tax=Pseudoxanthomonas daejeonensis TaxID=266062 RepID=A0ABQ6ZAM9_9GAMM|nr:DUF4124 domain-containing protein [Pseudoxanthomonas daejeonensis]KAF1696928.1 hypothetical protein CSC65_02510 [Pseudoxanthomonas daejeonensis]UNK56475.1 DUF4124 domain-containing protein [Pseudoxanthomonas daejeonensis]